MDRVRICCGWRGRRPLTCRYPRVTALVLGLAVAAGWVAIGAVAVALMRRRGHDAFSWALLFLFLGPIACRSRSAPIGTAPPSHRVRCPPVGSTSSSPMMGRPTRQAALESALALLGAADDLDDARRGGRPRGPIHCARQRHPTGGTGAARHARP